MGRPALQRTVVGLSSVQQAVLSRELFEEMWVTFAGSMGGQAGWAVRGCTKPLHGKPWALSYAIGSDVLVSTRRKRFDGADVLGQCGLTRATLFDRNGRRIGVFATFIRCGA